MIDQDCGDAYEAEANSMFQPLTPLALQTAGVNVGSSAMGNRAGLDILILHLWRFLGPASMDAEIRGRLGEALANAAEGWSGDWRDTMQSAIDPGSSIGPSVAFLHHGKLDSFCGDEIMSALALRGLGGDCAASAILANGLAMLAHGHQAAASLMELSDAWSSLASRQRVVAPDTRV